MDDFDTDPEEETPAAGLFRFYTPEDQEAGVHADMVAVWNTPVDFVIDFGSQQQVQSVDPEDPESRFEIPVHVVSRVRIPVALVFDVIQTISGRMSQYEAQWGEIHRPSPPTESEQE